MPIKPIQDSELALIEPLLQEIKYARYTKTSFTTLVLLMGLGLVALVSRSQCGQYFVAPEPAMNMASQRVHLLRARQSRWQPRQFIQPGTKWRSLQPARAERGEQESSSFFTPPAVLPLEIEIKEPKVGIVGASGRLGILLYGMLKLAARDTSAPNKIQEPSAFVGSGNGGVALCDKMSTLFGLQVDPALEDVRFTNSGGRGGGLDFPIMANKLRDVQVAIIGAEYTVKQFAPELKWLPKLPKRMNTSSATENPYEYYLDGGIGDVVTDNLLDPMLQAVADAGVNRLVLITTSSDTSVLEEKLEAALPVDVQATIVSTAACALEDDTSWSFQSPPHKQPLEVGALAGNAPISVPLSELARWLVNYATAPKGVRGVEVVRVAPRLT